MERQNTRRTCISDHVLLVLIIWLFIFGCGGGGGGSSSAPSPPVLSPQETVRGFSSALLDNNIQNAVGHITEGSRDIYSRKLADADNNARLILAEGMKNAREVSRTDNVIVYKATMKRPDNQTVEPTFTLRLEKGVWKISGL
jgi:hypothetical protein